MKAKKMNIKTILSITIFFLLSITSIAQEFTEEDNQFYLNELNNPTSEWINTALYKVIDNKVIEASPILENNFWFYDRLNQVVALNALYRLGSENTSNFAYRLLDTLDNNPTGGQDYSPLASHSRVEITEILCLMGDFSMVDYVFDFLNSGYRGQLDFTISRVLYLIIKNYPPYEERARQELEYNVFQGDNRIGALRQLEEVYGAEIIPLIIRVFKEDPESSYRMIVLDEYFSKYHNEIDLQGILREQLYADTTSSVRIHIAKVLLYGVGGARNYKFINEYLPNEANSNVHFLLNNRIDNYHPDQPDTLATTETMLDTLISYTNQCYEYEWITNQGIYNSLSKKLENAKKNLTKGNEKPAKNKIEAFQNEVAAQYEKHITEDGYKFLYYYSGYLIERL